MERHTLLRILASAGGGKTYNLSRVYISLLKENPHLLPHILGITFTNKAANEMKERILYLLKEEALNGDKHSEEIVETILDNFSDFSIKTIDSFMNSILRSFALELGISPDVEINVNEAYYKDLAYERMIERMNQKVELKKLLLDAVDFLTREGISKSWKPWNYPRKYIENIRDKVNTTGIKLKLPVNSDEEDPLSKEIFFSKILVRLYNAFTDELASVKEEFKVILISELGAEINSLLKGGYGIPFIYYKVGERFLHFLIDEFQDTNVLQWNNIFPLVENALSQSGTLLYVGDPKQAIYQWRGGDVSLFDSVYNAFSFIEDKERLYLEKNYRSKKNILEFVMKLFSFDNLVKALQDDMGVNIERFYASKNVFQSPGRKELEEGGYVLIEKVIPENSRSIPYNKIEEIFKEWIKGILKRRRMGEVAVLVRTKNEGSLVVSWLNDLSIPAVSAESLHIDANQVVKELISFLKFINNPMNDMDFLFFITGRVFTSVTELKIEEILRWVEGRKEGIPLYIQFRESYPDVWEGYINPLFNMEGYFPVYEIITELIGLYNIYSNPVFREDIAFIEGFLDSIHRLEKSEGNSTGAIVDWWEQNQGKNTPSINLPENIEAVQVLTVHKAKGLEFPVVLIPFTVHTFPTSSGELLYKKSGDGFYPIKKPSSKGKKHNALHHLISEQFQADLFSETNLFYVALTRAMEELYIIYVEPKKTSSLKKRVEIHWSNIIKSAVDEFPYEMGSPLKKRKGERTPPLIPSKKEDVGNLIDKIIIKRPLWRRGAPLPEVTGTLFHRIMEVSNNLDREEIFKNMEIVLKEVLPSSIVDIYRKELTPLLNNLFDIDGIYELFSKNGEREVWGVDREGLLRMDRLEFRDDSIFILDFKTGSEEEDARKQMERYKRFMKSIYPDKKIKGFIINVREKMIEEV